MSLETTAGTLALLMALMGPAHAQSTGSTSGTGSDQMSGRHSMQGTITSLDQKKGWVHLKTHEGTLILRVPPESIRNAKKGDPLTVNLALKDNGPAKPDKR